MKLIETLNATDLDAAFRETLTEMGAQEAEAVLAHDQERINQIRGRMDTLAQYHAHCQEERRQVEAFFNDPNATELPFLRVEQQAQVQQQIESAGDALAQQDQQQNQNNNGGGNDQGGNNGGAGAGRGRQQTALSGRKGGEVRANASTRGGGAKNNNGGNAKGGGGGRGRGRSKAGQFTTATELGPIVLQVLQEEGPKGKYSEVQQAVKARMEREGLIKPQDLKPISAASKTIRLMSQIAAVKRTLDKHQLIGNDNGKVIITPAGIQSLQQRQQQAQGATA